MNAPRFFETSVSVDNSSRRNIPEGLNIQQQGIENVVPYSLKLSDVIIAVSTLFVCKVCHKLRCSEVVV